MPRDWLTPTLDFASTLLWPAVVLTLLILFRRQIGSFINDITEVAGFGASAKRGDRRVSDLKKTTEDASEESGTTLETPAVADEESSPTPQLEVLDNAARTPAAFLTFYRDLVRVQLRAQLQGTQTTSTRLSAQIVRSTYSILLLSVRVVAYWVSGPQAMATKRGALAASQVTLGRIDAPPELTDLVRELRDLAMDVAKGSIELSGDGARSYIESVDAACDQLFTLALTMVDAAPTASDKNPTS